jgi:hypothetical protein
MTHLEPPQLLNNDFEMEPDPDTFYAKPDMASQIMQIRIRNTVLCQAI